MSSLNGEMTYTWIIENYSFCDIEKEKCLRSPYFTVDDSDCTQWSILLYPRGNQVLCEDYVSLLLHRSWKKLTDRTEIDFSVEFCYKNETLFTLDKKDAKAFPVHGRAFYNSYSFEEVIKIDELEKKMKKTAIDCLRVRCHFTFNSRDNLQKKNLITRKILGIDQFTFLWDVKYHESSEWIVMKKFAILQSRFEIVLKAPEDDIMIEILKTGNDTVRYCRVKCKLTLLSAEGKGPSRCDSFLFDNKSEKNIWYFPTFFKRSSLNEKLKYFSGRMIKLKCNVSVSNGCVESESDLNETEHPCIQSSFNSEAGSSLQFDLRNMLLSKKYADVNFRIGKEVISCHKNILATRSPVLSAIFDKGEIENQTSIIDISDKKPETMKQFFEFLYSDVLEELNCKKALELLLVADKYQVPLLKEECLQFLYFNLNSKNICDVISMADMLGHAVLKTAAIDYIKKNAANVIDSPNWVKWINNNVELSTEILNQINLQGNKIK